MAANAQLTLVLQTQDRMTKDLDRLDKRLKTLGKTSKSMSSSFKASFGSLGTILGAGAGGGLAAMALKTGFSFDSMMESAQLTFETILKDGPKAQKFMSDLLDFAKKTPFDAEGLIKSSRELLAFGFKAEQVLPLLTDIGNAVSGLGGGADILDRMTLAFGQMKTKGKASTEELNQLAEAGVPVWQMLKDNVDALFGTAAGDRIRTGSKSLIDRLMLPKDQGGQGFSLEDATSAANQQVIQRLMKLVEQGKLSADKTIEALRSGIKQMFPDLMAKQADTMAGKLSNLNDAWEQLMGTVTEGAFGPGKNVITGLTDALGGAQDIVKGLPAELKQVLGIGAVLMGGLGGGLLGGLSGGPLGALGGILGGGGGGGGGNPMLLILLALLAVGSLLFNPLKGLLDWFKGGGISKVSVTNWPNGGGGGFPSSPIALPSMELVVTALLKILPRARDEVQAQIDAWPDLQKKLALLPTPADQLQKTVDAYPDLMKKLALSTDSQVAQADIDRWWLDAPLHVVPQQDTAVAEIDKWYLDAPIALNPDVKTVQDQLDGWDDLMAKLGLDVEPQRDVQGGIDDWEKLRSPLDLDVKTRGEVQGEIDAWATLSKKLGFDIEGRDDVQGQVDQWPSIQTGLGWLPVGRDLVQLVVDQWESIQAKLGFLLPERSAVQDQVSSQVSGLWLSAGVKLPSDYDMFSRLPGWAQYQIGGAGYHGMNPISVPPPGLPKFGQGGIAMSPTLAWIGDRPGGEVVMGLDQLDERLGTGPGGRGAEVHNHYHLHPGIVTTPDVHGWWRRMQDENKARGGT